MRVFRLGRRTVDLDRAIVVYDAEAIGLTSLETRLLDHLARRAGEIVPRDELLTEVWGYRPGVQTRTIDATTGRLRAKLEDDPTAPRHLFTVYGQGLRLDGVEGPPSGFFGRADELAHALERLRTARRVAFVGPAGVGKSRVAVELVARARLASAEVACRSLRSGSDVDQAVARRLDLAGPVGPALARLGALVVVLDECDDCVDAVAERVPHWLAEAPRLCVVATSRVRIPGEPPVSLEPLPEDDALALFLARAGAPDTERTTVRRVVQALEGLPLALELAAARFSLIGPDRLVELLGAPLEVLSGRGRTSMAEVLERSFERLDPVDRRALAAASTFEGPFDLDALAAVVGAARGPALDALDALVSQSLVRVVQPGVYRLFAVVRDRARRDLTGADPLWDAHATWFGRLGEPERLLSMDPADRRAARAAEADLAAAVARRPDAWRCGVALVRLLGRHGPAVRALELAAAVAPKVDDPRARVLLALSAARARAALGDARAAADAVSAAVPWATHPHDQVMVRVSLAAALRRLGDEAGAAEALAQARPWLDDSGSARAEWLQKHALFEPDLVRGEALLREAAREARRYGDEDGEMMTLALLSEQIQLRGGWDELFALVPRFLELARRPDPSASIRGGVLYQAARALAQRGDLDEAEALFEEAATLAVRCGPGEGLPTAIRLEIARIWMLRGRLDDARREIVPLTWETAPTSFAAALALVSLGRLELDDPRDPHGRAAAAVALRAALEHAERGSFDGVVRDAQDLLALATGDPSHLAPLDGSPELVVRGRAIRAILADERGDRDTADAERAAGRAEAARLGLGPDSDAVRWLGR